MQPSKALLLSWLKVLTECVPRLSVVRESGKSTAIKFRHVKNARSPKVFNELPNMTTLRLVQLSNALLKILLVASGMIIVSKLVHDLNASTPITSTEGPIVTFFRPPHLWKAAEPILITETPILTETSESHSKKALALIAVHSWGILTCPSLSGLIVQLPFTKQSWSIVAITTNTQNSFRPGFDITAHTNQSNLRVNLSSLNLLRVDRG